MERRRLTIVVRVAVLTVMTVAATRLWVEGTAPAAAQTPPPECTNSDDPRPEPVWSSARGNYQRCVAELWRSTRGNRIKPGCILDVKAAMPLAEYTKNECKGGRGYEDESIAHARAIAAFNRAGVEGDSSVTGITPNLQWEVAYPAPVGPIPAGEQRNRGGRVDILRYDRTDPDGGIELVEVKRDGRGLGADEAVRQLMRYQRDLPTDGRQVVRHDLGSYFDAFRIVEKECQGPNSIRIAWLHLVFPAPEVEGVLLVSDKIPNWTVCSPTGQPTDDPAPPPTGVPIQVPRPEEVPVEPPVVLPEPPPVVAPTPGRDADDNGDDDFWEWAERQFPQEVPVGEPPIEEHPIWDELKELVGGAATAADDAVTEISPELAGQLAFVAGAIGLVAACALFCAELAAWAVAAIAGLKVSLVGSVGAATLGPVAAILVVVIVALILWNTFGDPHLATPDGFSYDLQTVGEHHLLQIPSEDIDVQARFVPAGTNVSQLGAVATEINEHQVELGSGLVVDGVDVPLADGEVHGLGDGASVMRSGATLVVLWPGTGNRLMMAKSGPRVGFHIPDDVTDAQGLLGNANGDPSDDLAYPDGTPLPVTASAETVHGPYADAWRVSAEDSLFSYGAGQSTATFTDLMFPSDIVTLADLTQAEVAAASEVCTSAGVVPGPQFEDCVLDVALTGDDGYAEDAALVTDVLTDGSEHGFDSTGALGEDFEGTVGPNFTSPRYTEDVATSRVAGPLFDTPGYRMYARAVPRHHQVEIEADLLAYGPVATDAHEQSVALQVGEATVGSVVFDGVEPTLTGGLAGTVEEVDSGTTAGGQPFIRLHLAVTVPHSAASLDLSFVPLHFRGLLGTALGIDDLDLQLVVPPAQGFAAALPVVVPDAGLGTGTGSIEVTGGQDQYTFELDAPQQLLLDQSSCGTPLSIALVDTTTDERTSLPAPDCRDILTDELPAGEYRLEVWSEGAGTYALTLSEIPPPDVFDYTLGTMVSDGVPAAGAGNMETIVSRDQYRFSVPAGGLTLQYQLFGHARAFTITDRDTHEVVHAGSWLTELTLPEGDYQIEFAHQQTTYAFWLFPIPTPQTFDYTIGSTVSNGVPGPGAGNMETMRSVDRYHFSIPAGGMTVQYQLYGHARAFTITDRDTDEVVHAGSWHTQMTLPEGDYQLEFADQEGGYSFKIFEVVLPQTFAYELGTWVWNGVPESGAGNMETMVSVDRYHFSIPEGGMTVQYQLSGEARTYTLTDRATGAVIAHDYWHRQMTLPEGDYQIEFANQEGTYAFWIFEVPAPQTFAYELGTWVWNGVPESGAGNMETMVSVDRYHFSIPEGGMTVQYQLSGEARTYTLTDRATGAVIAHDYWHRQMTLPEGDYQIEFANQAGTYAFWIFEVPEPQTFEYQVGWTVWNGVPAAGAGNMETMVSVDRYHFSIPEGGMTVQYQLFGEARTYTLTDRATGAVIAHDYWHRQMTLPEGDYQLEFANQAGGYAFWIFEVPEPQTFAYELGTWVWNGVPEMGAGNMETMVSVDRYHFSIPEGGMTVRYELSGEARTYTLTDRATGAVIAHDYWFRTMTLPEGDYQLEFANQAGGYSFRLDETTP